MIASDLRYAVRTLWKNRLFAAGAVLSLGLGIGVNSAMFGLFNHMLWCPLPVEDPGNLVTFYTRLPNQPQYGAFSYPDYRDYASQGVADGLVAFVSWPFALSIDGRDSVRLFGECVSGNYFQTLKPRMHLGRGLRPEEGTAIGGDPVAVLGYRLWQRHFRGDPAVVGKPITLNGQPFTVVGVAAPEFRGAVSVLVAADVWVPLTMLTRLNPLYANHLEERTQRDFQMIGRLRPGTTVNEAQAAANTVASSLAVAYPATNRGLRVYVFRELDTRPTIGLADVARAMAAGFIAVTILVLLIACANVATLLLGRASAREREVATRVALGASRARIVRQLMAESFVLSLVACVVGVFAGVAAGRLLGLLPLPAELPAVIESHADLRVVLFTLGVSLLASVAFGLVPALRASRWDPLSSIKGSACASQAPGASARPRRITLNRGLVVGQVAASLLLLVLAGLFLRSIGGARTIDPGFRVDRRLVVDTDPSLAGYSGERTATFYRTVLDHVRRLPSIESATLACGFPLSAYGRSADVAIEGRVVQTGEEKLEVVLAIVDNDYFRTLGTRVTEGRPLGEHDTATSVPVVVVNQTFARRHWPGQQALGKRVQFDAPRGPWMKVVGVAADGKYRDLSEPPTPALFVPYAQHLRSDMTLLVAGRGDMASLAAALQRELKAVDPTVPIFSIKTMEQHLARVELLPRLLSALIVPAGLLAVAISVVGLYAVTAYSVRRRNREIGIRIAVGAGPRSVLGLVLRDGLALVAVGTGIGLLAAGGCARLVSGLLLGVTAVDPAVFVGVPALLAVVAGLACYLPARRALRVDPVSVLREE